MYRQSDHDLLIQISTDISYIKDGMKVNKKDIIFLQKENEVRKDWQEAFMDKTKIYVTVASVVGGIIVFITDKLILWFTRK